MDLTTLVMVAGSYAAATVAKKVAEVHIEELYHKLLNSFRGRAGASFEFGGALQAPEVSSEEEEIVRELVEQTPVLRRLRLVAPLAQGSRLLWIDDIPSGNLYEKAAMAPLNVRVDEARSNEAGAALLSGQEYDVVISDIDRGRENSESGLQLLPALLEMGYRGRVVFYVGELDLSLGTPAGAHGITNRPDELFHLVMDIIERRKA